MWRHKDVRTLHCKTVCFFSQNQFSVDSSRALPNSDVQPGTYDLQPANYTLPQKENKILILLPILRRITSDQSSIFPLFHDAVKTLHVRLQNSQFFFSLKISLALTVRAFFKFWPATCKLHPLRDSKLDCSRVFYQVTLATYYQVNQSRRITSYPGWLVVDYHVVELRQQIL